MDRQKIVLALQTGANTFKLQNSKDNYFLDKVTDKPGRNGSLNEEATMTYYDVSPLFADGEKIVKTCS
jgi:hypothetical protein